MTLGQRIREARRARGMTQRELAAGTHSISFISMIEHDRVRPSLATLRLLAERVGRPLSQLLDGGPAGTRDLQVRQAEALLRQHRFTEALEAFTAAARVRGDLAHQVRCELGRGQALAGLRQFDLAEAHLGTAKEAARRAGDPELLAAAANALGFLALRARRLAQAQEIFQDALAQLKAAGSVESEASGKLLANLGRVYVELGFPAQALECFRQASTALAAASDPIHLGLLYFNLGITWERQQAYDRAREYLVKAADLFALHENTRLLGMVRRSLGILHLERGDLPAAGTELEASLLLARQSGDDEGAAQTLVEVARLHAREGDLDAAQRAADQAASLADRISDAAEAARAQAAQAEILAAAGRVDEAATRYLDAASAFRHLGMTGELIRALRDLGFALLRAGRPEHAARWFAEAFELQRAPGPFVGETER